jgi:hypothetical protein
MIENIDSVELRLLTLEDYKELKAAMEEAYPDLPDAPWSRNHIKKTNFNFPRRALGYNC